jgi:transposase-like protein
MKKGITGAGKQSRARYEELEALVRMRVQDFVQEIIEEEITALLGGREKSERIKGIDKPKAYRNGYGKPRMLTLLNGTITIKRQRVRGVEGFQSKILPLFVRRTKEVGDLLPELYLHGLAKGDFELAMRGLLGEGAPLSPASIERLKAKWQIEYEEWKNRNLSEVKLVYQWADGIYVKAGLEKDKAALLVVIGATVTGKKVLLACESGYRESKESWAAILRDLQARGLGLAPLTVADGHLGIWSALAEIHPRGQEQRCWNHKITNVLDALPKRVRAQAGEYLSKIPYAETQAVCEGLRDDFIARYGKDFPKATETLMRDWDRMVSFYSFPKEHWVHIRTTNVVESPFSSVRLRTDAARRFKKVANATVMIWKLLRVAETRFRRLKSYWLLQDVYEGKRFIDGIAVQDKRSVERLAA